VEVGGNIIYIPEDKVAVQIHAS